LVLFENPPPPAEANTAMLVFLLKKQAPVGLFYAPSPWHLAELRVWRPTVEETLLALAPQPSRGDFRVDDLGAAAEVSRDGTLQERARVPIELRVVRGVHGSTNVISHSEGRVTVVSTSVNFVYLTVFDLMPCSCIRSGGREARRYPRRDRRSA
jgi:hypothetical protein